MPVMRGYDFCEREQFENLMIKKLDGGFESFKQCVNDMGGMIIKRGNDDCLFYDSFLNYAEDQFGKNRVYAYIENAENENVFAFCRQRKKSEADESDDSKLKIMTATTIALLLESTTPAPKEEKMTIEKLIDRAKELAAEKDPFPFRIRGYARQFAKQAKKKELKTLARAALDEQSAFVKTALLLVFSFADFPLDIEPLIKYALSDDEHLRDVVVRALSRFRDKRIHTLALWLFNGGQAEDALALLEANFEIEDEAIIRKHTKSFKRITHVMVMSITKIYKNHKSKTCGDILLHFYKNVECTHCRSDVVEAMINNDVMPRAVREECRYDSYERTRELAEEALGNSE